MKLLAMQFPGKPVRYAAITHPHFDHIGGVRGAAAAGATILTASGHERPIRALLEARHTNPADALDTNRSTGGKVGTLSLFDEKYVLRDGDQTLELYALTGSPHADPIVVAFVPKAGVLFQSDLYFPATGAPRTPEAAHLLQSLRKLGITPAIHAGGHGGVAPFDELVQAIGE
jgi:glyoxylase-like metal-dependent hydrolase (beta-lactamase superfamily II)